MNSNNPNQLSIEVVGTGTNTNPNAGNDSSSRQQMMAVHLKAALVVDGSTPKRNITGVERELGKYTFAHRIPRDSTIIAVIPKYQRQMGSSPIKQNPETLVIFEDFETKVVDHIILDKHHFRHTSIGFEYKFNKQAVERLQVNEIIPGGTVIADSPNVDEMGNYNYGIETNVAFMSLPGIIEDGFIVSESYTEKLKFTMLGERSCSCGKNYFPLNLYGDENNYKPFPGPGERIRDDGLVFALRAFDPKLSATGLLPKNLLAEKVNPGIDKTIYGEPNARVVDVTVLKDFAANFNQLPTGMEDYLESYVSAHMFYYQKIMDEYNKLYKTRRKGLQLTPHFQALVVEAMKNLPSKEKIQRFMGKHPIDNYNIKIRYAFKRKPGIGYKITDQHGTKH